MKSLARPIEFSKQRAHFQISTIAAALILAQVISPPPKAEANVFSDTVSIIVNSAAVKYGFETCGWVCATGAVLGIQVAKYSVPKIASNINDLRNGGIRDIFFNWGATYLRP